MNEQKYSSRIAADIRCLGIQPGDILLVHSSLRALGWVRGGPEEVVLGLLKAIGENGTLLMPALSYEQIPAHIHNTRETPSNIGIIPETFRRRAGTLRSVHPTHSMCGVGPAVASLFLKHSLDTTPCGPHSPFRRLTEAGAKIVMLGCGLRPNTTMHALEEFILPPYLFGEESVYTMTNGEGQTYKKKYRTHGFRGWVQRYDRVAELPDSGYILHGKVLAADTFIIDAARMKAAVLEKMSVDPVFFVDRASAADLEEKR